MISVLHPTRIEIPAYFKDKARRQFGEKGPGWVDRLPEVLVACTKRTVTRVCVLSATMFSSVNPKIEEIPIETTKSLAFS